MNNSEDRDIEIIENSSNSTVGGMYENPEKKEELNKPSLQTADAEKKLDRIEKRKKYIDFEIEIFPGKGQEYPVTLVHSPAGEVNNVMQFPFNKDELEKALKDIENALYIKRGILSDEEQKVKDFGRKLFDSLIKGEVRSCYNVSLREAELLGKGLRLKLRIKPPELAALPWEFIFDAGQGDYVGLCKTPVVRYLELSQSIKPLGVNPPLRILGMVASPDDLPRLNVKLEKKRVEESVRELIEQNLVEISWLPGQTWEDLQQAMRNGIWNIFHFIGHGGFDKRSDEGIISLCDKDGTSFLLNATQFGRFLRGHTQLRMVLLNSCEGARCGHDIFSSTASILVRSGIPAVLAMQYKISDKAAIEFSRAFYLAIADGMPVDAAVAEARIAVSVDNTLEWGVPVLYMRSPDGILFEIEKKAHDHVTDHIIKNFCPSCGIQNIRKKEFCRNCGENLIKKVSR